MTFLDIIEIYNIANDKELGDISAIFEDIDIDARLDKDILVSSLLDECGAKRCIYETTATFKYFSDMFFKKYKWNISKLLDTLELEYDPIKNTNLEWTETTKINQDLATEEGANESRTRENTGTQTNANTGTQTNTNTGTQTNEYEDETVNTVSAMNSSDYEPDNQRDGTGSNTRTDNLEATRTDNLESTRTDNLNESITVDRDRNKNENLTWDEEDKHIENGYKDSVVQDLIAKERKISEFSIYGWIARKYSKELFLLVY